MQYDDGTLFGHVNLQKKKKLLMPCQSNRAVYFCLLVCNILVHTTVL